MVTDDDNNRAMAPMVAMLDVRLQGLHTDVNEIKSALSDLATAITKLALIEERQAQTGVAMDRAFNAVSKLESKLEAIDDRLRAIEKNDVNQSRTSEYVDKAVWAALGLLAMFAASRLGLIG